MIVIIDYGQGNLGSIQNMLKRIGVKSVITSEVKDIEKASKLILPGVGAFDTGMKNLYRLQVSDVLKHRVLDDKVPILGICLGMQLLCDSSDEGQEKGLGFFNERFIRFKPERNIKVPVMGWSYVKSIKHDSQLIKNLPKNPKFYHVHSYHVSATSDDSLLEPFAKLRVICKFIF